MILLLHDNEKDGDTLVAQILDIDYDYQAEQWVDGTYQTHETVIRWELRASKRGEILRRWERTAGTLEYPKEIQLKK